MNEVENRMKENCMNFIVYVSKWKTGKFYSYIYLYLADVYWPDRCTMVTRL